jgi:hypothetical protein
MCLTKSIKMETRFVFFVEFLYVPVVGTFGLIPSESEYNVKF